MSYSKSEGFTKYCKHGLKEKRWYMNLSKAMDSKANYIAVPADMLDAQISSAFDYDFSAYDIPVPPGDWKCINTSNSALYSAKTEYDAHTVTEGLDWASRISFDKLWLFLIKKMARSVTAIHARFSIKFFASTYDDH